MRLLLDTHMLLWWLSDDERLSSAHRDLIADASNTVFVSAMTVAEITIKSSIGKLDAPANLLPTLEAGGFDELAFDSQHADRLRTLPWHHRDPFDRMLIAQAIAEGLTLLSADAQFAAYDIALG